MSRVNYTESDYKRLQDRLAATNAIANVRNGAKTDLKSKDRETTKKGRPSVKSHAIEDLYEAKKSFTEELDRIEPKGNKFRYFLGIDPDIKASGVARWDALNKKFYAISTYSFFDLLQLLDDVIDTKVYIEASWLINTTQWTFKGKSKGVSDLISKKVGQNRQIGILIEEYCKRKHIPYALHKPTTTKVSITNFRQLTGWQGKVNQDSIDSAMLVFNRAS